jgi:hypothetical protein
MSKESTDGAAGDTPVPIQGVQRRHADRPKGLPLDHDAEIELPGGSVLEFGLRPGLDAAALKHAYLAACLAIRGVPLTPSAIRIRKELMAVRDAPARNNLPHSHTASRISIVRTYLPPGEQPLALVELPATDTEPPQLMLSLADTILVSWPFDDISVQLSQGAPIDQPDVDR